eukprot:1778383-Rhodomonas_salina.1
MAKCGVPQRTNVAMSTGVCGWSRDGAVGISRALFLGGWRTLGRHPAAAARAQLCLSRAWSADASWCHVRAVTCALSRARPQKKQAYDAVVERRTVLRSKVQALRVDIKAELAERNKQRERYRSPLPPSLPACLPPSLPPPL